MVFNRFGGDPRGPRAEQATATEDVGLPPASDSADDTPDYEGMSKSELAVEINTRGIALRLGATKAEMIAALQEGR